jgi:hypothetical protein
VPDVAHARARFLVGRSGSASEVIRFSEGTLFVRVLENVRGRSVCLTARTATYTGQTGAVRTHS